MKKLKIKLLLLEYQNEIKQGNYDHLKDYIACNIILILLNNNFLEYDFNQITLNKLVNRMHKEKNKCICYYKVPSINILDYVINDTKKQLKNNLGKTEEYAAAIWFKLMLENNLIKENEVIDINKYCLYNFITDSKLIKLANISEFSNTDLRDFILDKPKMKVKINKFK